MFHSTLLALWFIDNDLWDEFLIPISYIINFKMRHSVRHKIFHVWIVDVQLLASETSYYWFELNDFKWMKCETKILKLRNELVNGRVAVAERMITSERKWQLVSIIDPMEQERSKQPFIWISEKQSMERNLMKRDQVRQ